MTSPWLELENRQPLEVPAGPGYQDYIWQAQFACQVNVRSYHDWSRLKWGFNAAALFDEFIDRQKLFLESQYEVRHQLGSEAPNYRTLAFRFINLPGEGLLVAVLGKIHDKTREKARESALEYYNEVKSTFPYDYSLVPAQSRDLRYPSPRCGTPPFYRGSGDQVRGHMNRSGASWRPTRILCC
jgi:hypothetical protein